MEYRGEFRDINEKLYKVNIITKGDSTSTTEVVLGDVPFLTEWESDDNTFKPCKYSSSTVKLITKDYLFDIYSNAAQDVKVELLDENDNIKWIGYTTPNLYNQGYETEIDELEIECVDGLSTLQYYDYAPIDGVKKVRTFGEILSNVLQKCHCYSTWYFPQCIQRTKDYTANTLSSLVISEQDFFDEDDEPMKCDEVLENICNFMGVTAVAYGDAVYFLDYDAVRRNFNTNFEYNITDITTLTRKELYDAYIFDESFYMENGQQISLSQTYNKVTVVDSLYSVDDVIPSIKDNKLMKNKLGADKSEIKRLRIGKTEFNSWYKFYHHKNYKPHYYMNKDMSVAPAIRTVAFYDDLQDMVGGTIIRNYNEVFDAKKNDIATKLDYKEYICIHNNKHYTDDKTTIPLLSIDLDKPMIIGGRDAYIVLQGEVIFNGDMDNKLPTTENEYGKGFAEEDLYIEGVLQFGDKYFNGGTWVEFPTTFRLKLDCDDNTKHLFNRSFRFKNNINHTYNLRVSEGIAVKLPQDSLLTTKPIFNFVMPRTTSRKDSFWNRKDITCYWLSNFECKIEIANQSNDVDFESDTKYVNTNDENYVNDFDDVKFKICSWDNKLSNYSCVAYKTTNGFAYLDTMYNRATEDSGRAEELYVKRIIRQYSTPCIILDLKLDNSKVKPWSRYKFKNFGYSKEFLVDRMEIDWRMNQNNCRLIEKR